MFLAQVRDDRVAYLIEGFGVACNAHATPLPQEASGSEQVAGGSLHSCI